MMSTMMGGTLRVTLPGRVTRTVTTTVTPIMVDMMSAAGAGAGADLRRLTVGYAYEGTLGGEVVVNEETFGQLLAKVQELAAQSTHPDAAAFDTALWLGEWIRKPQPALGGRRPEDLLDTPTGQAAVMRVLGAMESGASL